ncbi:hypothetical protein IV84_GL000684 [Pediococcus damnosus]|nr:hypothetical protein IV84_GL000684 [Pediococcus damnosus]
MNYSIGEVAEKMGTNTSTLRYYDKKGLLPFVDRDAAGRRKFKDNDFNFLKVINCLKKVAFRSKTLVNLLICVYKVMELCKNVRQRRECFRRKSPRNAGSIRFLKIQKVVLQNLCGSWYGNNSLYAGN